MKKLLTLLLSVFLIIGFLNATPIIPTVRIHISADTTQLPAFNSPITLNGSGSADPDGQIVAYQWTQIGTTPMLVVIQNAQNAIATITPPAGKQWAAGVYTFELSVQDNNGAVSKAQTHVTISPNPHLPPTVIISSDITIQAPTNSTSASVSATTTDGATVTAYLWTMISGPTQATFSAPNSNSTNIGNLAVGTYQIRVKVTDSKAASAADTMLITVKVANNAPVSNAGQDQQVILPVKSVSIGGVDRPDGLAVQWRKTSGPSSFLMLTPQQSFTTVTNLQKGKYTFIKTVMDRNSGQTATDAVNVTVRKKTLWESLFGWL